MTPIQEVPLSERFRPEEFDGPDLEIIVGALNKFGVSNLTRATTENLTAFTWEQVLQSLLLSRRACVGDALDDTDDVIYAVRDIRREYVH